MEIKFSVCGPDIGGAKSGINFNPNDPRRDSIAKMVQSSLSDFEELLRNRG
ncbi:MAG: hypothetical protein R2784_20880 [Saprospiraceae bacterium]